MTFTMLRSMVRFASAALVATLSLAAADSAGAAARRHPGSREGVRKGEGARQALRRQRTMEALRESIAQAAARRPAPGPRIPAALRVLAQVARTSGLEAARAAAGRLGLRIEGDRVLVGIAVEGSEGPAPAPRAWVGLDDLDAASTAPGVRGLLPVRILSPHAVDEGVEFTGADAWQGFSPPAGLPLGRPVRVAIIDAGFQGYEALLGDDLPADVETATFCGDQPEDIHGCGADTRHGTAVAEILHDMAPEAELILIAIDLSGGSVEQAALYAQQQGADIVSTSLGSRIGNREGTGGLCQTAARLREDGILWVFSAGNEGDACLHEHYSWRPSGENAGTGYGSFQSFPDKREPVLNEFTLPANTTQVLELTWTPFDEPPDDYDLFYFCKGAGDYELIGTSDDTQCGQPGSEAYEAIAVQNPSNQDLECAYAVAERDVDRCPHRGTPQFDVFSEAMERFVCWDLEEATSSFSIGHPADCPLTVAVGAVCVQSGNVEFYSSQGPTLDNRSKPDICAPDATSTETFGSGGDCPSDPGGQFFGFTGTSGAAPHMAGALALLYGKLGGSFGLERILEILERRAVDVGPPGADNLCGAGALCLLEGGCGR